MPVIWLLVMIALIGLAAWALITFIPMPAIFCTIIVVVAVIACIVLAVRAFGAGGPPLNPRI